MVNFNFYTTTCTLKINIGIYMQFNKVVQVCLYNVSMTAGYNIVFTQISFLVVHWKDFFLKINCLG